jgi:hypothetical protein
MTLGKGVRVYGTSTSQKTKIKTSIEADLVSINDFMPQDSSRNR